MNGQSLEADEAARLNDAALDMCRAMVAPPVERNPRPDRK
jgi:hypothetical protein